MTSTSKAYARGGLCPGEKGVSSVENLEKCGWILLGTGVSVAIVSTIVIVLVAAAGKNTDKSSRVYAVFLYMVAAALVAVMIQVMFEVCKGYIACGKSYSGKSQDKSRKVSGDGPSLDYKHEVIHDDVVSTQEAIRIEDGGGKVQDAYLKKQHGSDCISCRPGDASDLLAARKWYLPYVRSEVVDNVGKAGSHEREVPNSGDGIKNCERLFSSVAVGTADVIEFRSFGNNKVIYGVNSSRIHDFAWVNGVWKSFSEGRVFVRGTGTGENRTVALQIGDLRLVWPDFEVFAHKGKDVLWQELKYDINLICDLRFPPGYDMQPGGVLLVIPEESKDGLHETRGEIFYKVSMHATYNNLVGLMFSYENARNNVGESLFLRYLGVYNDFFDLSMLVRRDIEDDGRVTLRINSDLFFGSRIGRQLATDMVRYREGFLRAISMYSKRESHLAALCCFFERIGNMIPKCFHVHDDDMRSGTLFDFMGSIYALSCGRSSGYFVDPSPARIQALYYVFFSSSVLRAACIFQDISSKFDALHTHEQSYFSSCIKGLAESINALLRLFSYIRDSDAHDRIGQMYSRGSDIEKAVLWAVLLSSLKFGGVIERVLREKEKDASFNEKMAEHRYRRLLSNDPSGFCVMSLDAISIARSNDILSSLVPYAVAETLVAFLEGSRGERILMQITGERVQSKGDEQDYSSLKDLSDWAVVRFITRDFPSNDFGGLLSAAFSAHVLPLSGSNNFCSIVLPVSFQKGICGSNSDCTTKAIVEEDMALSSDCCKATNSVSTSLQNLSVSTQAEKITSAVCL